MVSWTVVLHVVCLRHSAEFRGDQLLHLSDMIRAVLLISYMHSRNLDHLAMLHDAVALQVLRYHDMAAC